VLAHSVGPPWQGANRPSQTIACSWRFLLRHRIVSEAVTVNNLIFIEIIIGITDHWTAGPSNDPDQPTTSRGRVCDPAVHQQQENDACLRPFTIHFMNDSFFRWLIAFDRFCLSSYVSCFDPGAMPELGVIGGGDTSTPLEYNCRS
jgi:hypothetical protein